MSNATAPAYPVPDVIDHDRNYYQYGGPGLTKREAFAMAAMQSLVAKAFTFDPSGAARMATSHADALLAAISPSEEPRNFALTRDEVAELWGDQTALTPSEDSP